MVRCVSGETAATARIPAATGGPLAAFWVLAAAACDVHVQEVDLLEQNSPVLGHDGSGADRERHAAFVWHSLSRPCANLADIHAPTRVPSSSEIVRLCSILQQENDHGLPQYEQRKDSSCPSTGARYTTRGVHHRRTGLPHLLLGRATPSRPSRTRCERPWRTSSRGEKSSAKGWHAIRPSPPSSAHIGSLPLNHPNSSAAQGTDQHDGIFASPRRPTTAR